MLEVNDFTIIAVGVLLAVAVITPFINLLMARLGMATVDGDEEQGDSETEALGQEKSVGVSVLLTVGDEADDLKTILPLLLSQDYKGEYQIVVVQTDKDDAVDNILKSYRDEKRLYTTFIPMSSKYMSRRKLAVTVGVKAAKYDWVLLTDVECRPASDKWLAAMAGNCRKGTDLVLGYCGLDEDYSSQRRFDLCYNLSRQLAFVQRKGYAWGYCGSDVLFSKAMFIKGKGFEGNLKFIRGEYDFLVNKFSTAGNTVVATQSDSRMLYGELTDKQWRNKWTFYMETRRHLAHTRIPRMVFNTTFIAMLIGLALPVGFGVCAAVTSDIIIVAAAAVALLLNLVLRCVVVKRGLGDMCEGIGCLHLLWLEMTLPLRNLKRIINHRVADSYDFISHKI